MKKLIKPKISHRQLLTSHTRTRDKLRYLIGRLKFASQQVLSKQLAATYLKTWRVNCVKIICTKLNGSLLNSSLDCCVCVCVCEKFSFSFSNLSNVIINLQRARKSILAAILTILTIFRKWKTEKYEKKKVSHSIVSHSVWRAIQFFELFNLEGHSIWWAIQSFWAVQFGGPFNLEPFNLVLPILTRSSRHLAAS